jgi:hypothetical protein
MYGGLFGDLPAAKNEAQKGIVKTEEATSTNPSDSQQSSIFSDVDAAVVSNNVEIETIKNNIVMTPMIVPRKIIPTHAMRPRPQQLQRKRPLQLVPTEPLRPTMLTPPETAPTASLVNVHHVNQNSTAGVEKPQAFDTVEVSGTVNSVPSALPSNSNHQIVHVIQESEELRKLHERGQEEDPYDPMIPNDLLLYWERKVIAAEQERLAMEREETIRDQEILRQLLEQERTELRKEGDVNKIVEHRLQRNMGLGGGRGGVSNLPAWLVEKQKLQLQQQTPSAN